MTKSINRKILGSTIAIALSASVSTSVYAIANGDILSFDAGVKSCAIGGTFPTCDYGATTTAGSYFSMNADGGSIADSEKTVISINNGIILGSAQAASGSHTGAPDGTEAPDIDNPWSFFGNTGMHQTTSAITILSDDGAGNVTLDFAGWNVTWNGIPSIPMGGDTANFPADNNIAVVTCYTSSSLATQTDCLVGTFFVLDHADVHVPLGDPSSFGGVPYTAHLEGTITAGNATPVAVPDSINPAYLGSAVTISPAANDTDADTGETATLTATCNNDSTKGVVTDNGDSSCTYQPGSSSADIGADSFTYTVSDVNGATATGTVSVDITDQDAPVISITAGTDSVEIGSSWTDAGATATDNLDATATASTSDTVDTSTVGTYTITYTATDAAGNTATADRTVTVTGDVTAPVITVTSGTDSVVVNGSWTDAGATATDNVDTSVTVTTSGSVDTTTIGSYTITYTATDTANNTATATRTVTITATPDTTAPVVTVTPGTDSIFVGDSWTDAGATATDDVDGTLTASASGSVNTSVAGSYTITYTATDAAGNVGTATRTVTVAPAPDTTAPVITVAPGTDSVVIGNSWTDAGATAIDDVDGSITPVVSGSVDTNTVGSYTITYTATDAANNIATATRTVTVTAAPPADTTPPVVTITTGTDSIEAGSSWTDAGATATDDVDGTLTASASGSVDTSTAGTYTITYTATDAAGNVGTATRTVTITADVTAPVITVAPGTDSVVVGNSWTDAGATATDNLDASVTVTSSGSVDTNTAGSYTITYSATDAASNTATATRTVTVTAAANDDDNENIFGCSMSPTSINASNAADWWVVAGFIGFMAVRRRKTNS